jgi:hypothetical protein
VGEIRACLLISLWASEAASWRANCLAAFVSPFPKAHLVDRRCFHHSLVAVRTPFFTVASGLFAVGGGDHDGVGIDLGNAEVAAEVNEIEGAKFAGDLDNAHVAGGAG